MSSSVNVSWYKYITVSIPFLCSYGCFLLFSLIYILEPFLNWQMEHIFVLIVEPLCNTTCSFSQISLMYYTRLCLFNSQNSSLITIMLFNYFLSCVCISYGCWNHLCNLSEFSVWLIPNSCLARYDRNHGDALPTHISLHSRRLTYFMTFVHVFERRVHICWIGPSHRGTCLIIDLGFSYIIIIREKLTRRAKFVTHMTLNHSPLWMGLQSSNEKFENSSKGSVCAHVLQQHIIDDISVFQANMVSKFVSSLENSKFSNLSRC